MGKKTAVETTKQPVDIPLVTYKLQTAAPSTKAASEHEPTRAPRECRDIIFLLVFAVFLVGMGLVTWRSMRYGDPARIMYGQDSWGNVCNQQNDVIDGVTRPRTGLDMRNRPYVFYFKEDLLSLATTGDMDTVRICLSKCPSATISNVADMKTSAQTDGPHMCVYDIPVSQYFKGNSDGLGDCPPLPIKPHTAILHRCIPNDLTKRLGHVLDAVHSLFDVIDENFLEKCASDILNTWGEMVLLCLLGFIVALVVVLLMHFFASIIVWTMVVGVVIGTVVATGLCWYHYYTIKTDYAETPADDRTEDMKKAIKHWLIGAIVVSVVTVIVILILLAVRKHIALVVQLFKEAGKAIRKMPLLLFQPVVTIVFLAGPILGLGYILAYIETAGYPAISEQTGFVSYKPDKILKYMKWYHIFGIIWISQFVMACHKLTVAGAVSYWYFTRNKKTLSFPILKSVGNIVRYHIGSLAFGSLLLTIVYFIRMGLSFIEDRLRGREHPVAMFLLKCLKCCIWCFEKFLKFLNTNAYIEIAIHGYGFCKAARQAFLVIVNNALRVVAINSVGDFVLFLGKVGIIAIVCVTGIELISLREEVNYAWVPVTLVAICTYFISTSFMSVYEMAVDTIFLCFCEDSTMNDGQEKPYYMSAGLMRCMSASIGKKRRTIQVEPAEEAAESSGKLGEGADKSGKPDKKA